MNRHQRRAAGRQLNQNEPGDDSPPVLLNLGELARPPSSAPRDAGPVPIPPKPSLVLRILAKILLSSWVLNRVQHPDIERLLISFATQTNRPEVADFLIRRQALRSQSQYF